MRERAGGIQKRLPVFAFAGREMGSLASQLSWVWLGWPSPRAGACLKLRRGGTFQDVALPSWLQREGGLFAGEEELAQISDERVA